MTVSPDGTWLATVRSPREVRLWDVPEGPERTKFTGEKVVGISPDGTWLATYSGQVQGQLEAVRLWDMATDRDRTVLTGHHGKVEVSADGTWLVSLSREGSIGIHGTRAVADRPVPTFPPAPAPPSREWSSPPTGRGCSGSRPPVSTCGKSPRADAGPSRVGNPPSRASGTR
jgi:hypothetical protein